MKCVVIIRKNRELGIIAADIVDDYLNGGVQRYYDIYDSELYEVLSVNIVERLNITIS